MENNIKYMVCTRCMTYNQADYIADTLDGFCLQKTDFPVVYVIVDDASTDNERSVIERYLSKNFILNDLSIVREEETEFYYLTFARHNTNKNCYFATYYLKFNHYKKKSKAEYYKEWVYSSKYQASCEGDDYWNNPLKLQKQVEFLEKNIDYSAVFSNIVIRDETVVPYKEYRDCIKKTVFTINDVYKCQVFPINSICIRTDAWNKMKTMKAIKTNGDIKLAYVAAMSGKVYKFDEFFSVSRRTGKGLSSKWSASEQFTHNIIEWYVFFEQLGFPNKRALARAQACFINEYFYYKVLNGFHINNLVNIKKIKGYLFPSYWYEYLLVSCSFFFKVIGAFINKMLFAKS